MGTFTELTDADVTALARDFALGAVLCWRPIAAGTVNSNFAVETERGRFFLRVNEGKAEALVRYEAELVAALRTAGVVTPKPIIAADGAPLSRLGSKLVSAFAWVDGVHRDADEVTPGDARAVGVALAQLHLAGLPIADAFAHEGLYSFAQIVDRFHGFAGSADPHLAPAIAAVADEIAWLEARTGVRAAATQGIIHGDLFRDNVLFSGPRVAALIDFEQASTGSLAYDLAVCLNAWCYVAGALRPALIEAMIGGYAQVRPLPPADRAALPVEVRAAAMRFVVTRITDVYLAGIDKPEKDFRRYLDRLEGWQSLGHVPGLGTRAAPV